MWWLRPMPGFNPRLYMLLWQMQMNPGPPGIPYAGLGPMPTPPFPGAWRTPAGAPMPVPFRGPAGAVNGRVMPPDTV